MLNFDMTMAMGTVNLLQEAIASSCSIPVNKQVLLVSGGESLDPSSRVCQYSAGTDTNPIFVFSKITIESQIPPSVSSIHKSDDYVLTQIESVINLPPSYETLVARVMLVSQISEVDQELLNNCHQVVHEQHLQQQGWAAVLANLDDVRSAIIRCAATFQDRASHFLRRRMHFTQLLNDFDLTIDISRKIPLANCFSGCDGDGVSTLHDWISLQDNSSSLNELVEQCRTRLSSFSDQTLTALVGDVSRAIEACDNPSMKEVKGLEDRLYGLEQMMAGARKTLQEQIDMAQGFVANQDRVTTLGDPSILPDLCHSHQKQLQELMKNHQKLSEIKKKCTLAKDELGINIHARLRWVMYVQRQLCQVENQLVSRNENFRRIDRYMDVIEQINGAPSMYCLALVEVARRKIFSNLYTKWSATVSSTSTNFYSEESKLRSAFKNRVGAHFILSLFPGLGDAKLPEFALNIVDSFDINLPDITSDDVLNLLDAVPQMDKTLGLSSSVSCIQSLAAKFNHLLLSTADPVIYNNMVSISTEVTNSLLVNSLLISAYETVDNTEMLTHLNEPSQPIENNVTESDSEDMPPSLLHTSNFKPSQHELATSEHAIPHGSVDVDGGTTDVDGGTTDVDGGTTDIDGGTTDIDGDTTAIDGGTTAVDSGTTKGQLLIGGYGLDFIPEEPRKSSSGSEDQLYQSAFFSLPELDGSSSKKLPISDELDSSPAVDPPVVETMSPSYVYLSTSPPTPLAGIAAPGGDFPVDGSSQTISQHVPDTIADIHATAATLRDGLVEIRRQVAGEQNSLGESVAHIYSYIDKQTNRLFEELLASQNESTRHLVADYEERINDLKGYCAGLEAQLGEYSREKVGDRGSPTGELGTPTREVWSPTRPDNLRFGSPVTDDMCSPDEPWSPDGEFAEPLSDRVDAGGVPVPIATHRLSSSCGSNYRQIAASPNSVGDKKPLSLGNEYGYLGTANNPEPFDADTLCSYIELEWGGLADSGGLRRVVQTVLARQTEKLDGEVSRLKNILQGNRQTEFNEAVSQLKNEKDKRIAELELSIDSLKSRQLCVTCSRTGGGVSGESSTQLDEPPDIIDAAASVYSKTHPKRYTAIALKDLHKGDFCVIYFNNWYNNWMALSSGATLCFVHSDCKIEITQNKPVVVKVADKEYCQARKPNNRFGVEKGTKFYRIRVEQDIDTSAMAESLV